MKSVIKKILKRQKARNGDIIALHRYKCIYIAMAASSVGVKSSLDYLTFMRTSSIEEDYFPDLVSVIVPTYIGLSASFLSLLHLLILAKVHK